MIGLAFMLLSAAPLAVSAPQLVVPVSGADLVAEPQDVQGRFTTATEVKPILGATRANWIAVREYGGQDLVYVTHLWSWRCGLKQIRIGLNETAPEIWEMPECHEDSNAPNAIADGDGLPYRAFPLGSVETVEVELVYDDLTRETAQFDRAAILMP